LADANVSIEGANPLCGDRIRIQLRANDDWLHESLEGEPPPGRRRCAILPLDTMRRAIAELAVGPA
jgi:NifU-like protein involved in Fe-S cluster formation